MDQNDFTNNNFDNNNTNNYPYDNSNSNSYNNINNNQYENQNYANIFDATAKNDLQAVQSFLNAGTDPNIIDENGNTPLHILCGIDNPNAEIAQLLLNKGGFNFIENNKNETPFKLIKARADMEDSFFDNLYNNVYNEIKNIINKTSYDPSYMKTSLFKALNEKKLKNAKNICERVENGIS